MGYYVDVKGVKDSLVTTLQGCASFGSTKVFAYYLKSLQGLTYPVCFVRLLRDAPMTIGAKETEHYLYFSIEIHNTGTGTSSDLDKIISLVGEVLDKIEGDRGLGNSKIQNTEVTEVNYSATSNATAGIFYYAYITVQCRVIRNV